MRLGYARGEKVRIDAQEQCRAVHSNAAGRRGIVLFARNTSPEPSESMRRGLPDRIWFVLLLCCLPASMLLVIWIPSGVQAYLRENARWLLTALGPVVPLFPTWPQLTAVQALAAAMVAMTPLVWFAARVKRERPLKEYAFPLLLGGYAVWTALSYFWSAWPYGTQAHVVRELPLFVACAVAYFTCRTERRWATVGKVFVVAAAVQAALQTALILCMALSGHVQRWFVSMLLHGVRTVADIPAGAPRFNLSYLRSVFYEHPLFVSNKNFGSATWVTGALLALAWFVSVARDEDSTPQDILAGGIRLVGAWVVFGFLLLTSGSLAGFLALTGAAVVFAVCMFARRQMHWVLVGGVVLALVAAGVVLQSDRLRARLSDWALDPGSTAHLRVMYWTGTARMFAARPLLGWGAGTFPTVYPSFEPELASGLRFTKDVRNTHPHNEFIRVASETGVVGLVLYLSVLASAFVVAFVELRDRPLQARLFGYALWSGCVAYVVQSLFGKAPMFWGFGTQFWLLLGVLGASFHGLKREEEPEGERVRLSAVHWALFAAVAGVCAGLWWAWGVGAFRSNVELRRAELLRSKLDPRRPNADLFRRYTARLDNARSRCLWPTQVLYYDYVIGWHLTDLGQWMQAREYLTRRILRWSPDMLKVQLLLGRCAASTGRAREALDHIVRYVALNPYDLEGYQRLSEIAPARAAYLLHRHLEEVEGFENLAKVWELVSLYLYLQEAQSAREVVRQAGEQRDESPARIVSLMARMLRHGGQPDKVEHLRRAFPEYSSRAGR